MIGAKKQNSCSPANVERAMDASVRSVGSLIGNRLLSVTLELSTEGIAPQECAGAKAPIPTWIVKLTRLRRCLLSKDSYKLFREASASLCISKARTFPRRCSRPRAYRTRRNDANPSTSLYQFSWRRNEWAHWWLARCFETMSNDCHGYPAARQVTPRQALSPSWQMSNIWPYGSC